MLTSLQNRLKRAGRWLPVALLPFAAHAQFNYGPSHTLNVTGTYADLGTTGTAVATANTDDANSAAQPIGFTFNFNGAAFTQFVLNTNGLVRLGSAAPSSAAAFPAYAQAPETGPISGTNAADVNLLAPFNLDLGPGATGTEYRVTTTGTAPNRVCTIQWKNVRDKPQTTSATIATVVGTQLANFSFQVKLYETTDNVEFVYGPATAGTGTAAAKYAAVGIKGSDPTSSVLATKSSAQAWSTTTFFTGPYLDRTNGNGHNVRQTFLPDAGRTYRFVQGPICADPTNPGIVNVTSTSLQLTFTPGAGNVGYIVTYQSTCGTLQTVSPAPTGSPVTISGLTPGTTYELSLQSVCAGNVLGTPITGTVTTAAAGAPVNDNPSGAITLPVAATCTPVCGTNVGATTTAAVGYTNPGCGVAVNPKDVWFKFTTAAAGVGSAAVVVRTTGDAAGQLRVFSAGSSAGPFAEIGCTAGYDVNTNAGSLSLRNLSPSTTYYVFVSGVSSGDPQGSFTICALGVPQPTYLTPPYAEGFENTWASVEDTREAPTLNWRSAPLAGDSSWRRDDDGFASANWSYAPDETGPNPPYAVKASAGSHSARFHTYGAIGGTRGNLDLYANLSGAGAKTLSFDYINPTGSDILEVLVSTNGGATFTPAPLLTLTTTSAFANHSVAIPGNSATTVIRFRATSDFGDDDLGIDNLQLRVVAATRNEALAAAVSVAPNPAHQRFTLSVPAGSLRTASATLLNALGQVVATRQLSLPAAGGSTDFDVSRLAAGIYTLTLQSGNDLVVKRVVVE